VVELQAQPSALTEPQPLRCRSLTLRFKDRAECVGEWGTVFGDPVVATAILDRLLHHSQIITIRGDSYHLREKRRSGLLRKAAPAPEPIS
jgi:hypothetical protein